MITRISRNPARNNSSEIFWRNDKWPLRRSTPGSMRKNSKTAESNTKNVQSHRKQFPKSYFTQSIVTISRNPWENDSSIIFFRARNVFWMCPLRRNDYQNNSVKIILCNYPGAITGYLCRAPENNSPNIFSCKSPFLYEQTGPLSRNPQRLRREGALTGREK